MTRDEKTQLALALAATEALERRLAETQDQLSTLQVEFDRLKSCDECGVVFASQDAYGEHVCQGSQGR